MYKVLIDDVCRVMIIMLVKEKNQKENEEQSRFFGEFSLGERYSCAVKFCEDKLRISDETVSVKI